jgi:hypothetical protein
MEGGGVMDEMMIRINSTTGTMTVEETKNGIVSRKTISPEALLECFSQSIKRMAIRSGLLPPNVISYAQDDVGNKSVCLWHPELSADVSYYKTGYTDFPLPRLVFGFHVSAENRISSCRLGVIKDERLKPETPMYRYPFSNVDGFSLCIGSNPLPKCTSLHTLASVPYLLLAMPNNNDRYSPGGSKLRLDIRGLFEHLKDKDPAYYYSDVLIPSKKTLQDFILNNN